MIIQISIEQEEESKVQARNSHTVIIAGMIITKWRKNGRHKCIRKSFDYTGKVFKKFSPVI
jgi:hypothetical protein